MTANTLQLAPVDEDQAARFAPLIPALLTPLLVLGRRKSDPLFGRVLVAAGAFGFAWLVAQGLGIGLRGFTAGWLEALFGPIMEELRIAGRI